MRGACVEADVGGNAGNRDVEHRNVDALEEQGTGDDGENGPRSSWSGNRVAVDDSVGFGHSSLLGDETVIGYFL
jgi:hypothetical protein